MLSFTFVFALLLAVKGQSQTTMSSFEDAATVQQNNFYCGTNQHIFLKYWTAATNWVTQDLTTISGAPVSAPGSSVTSFKDSLTNEQHVIFQGADSHLYDVYSASNVSVWSYQDLTALTGAPAAAGNVALTSFYDAPNQVRFIFYIGADQHIDVVYWHLGWNAEDVSTLASAPAAAAGSYLTGVKDDAGNLEHVYYEGADQHIHELYTSSNPAQIFTTDDTAAAGATPAAPGSQLTSFFEAGSRQQDIFYIGIDSHVQHLFFVNYWQSEDLNALTSSTVAAPGSALTSFQDIAQNQLHVFFTGTDQHVHQFYYGGGAWSPQDVTAVSGAPIPALNSPMTSFEDAPQNQQHDFYLGQDGHFYHLYWSGTWFVQDLTEGTVVPAA